MFNDNDAVKAVTVPNIPIGTIGTIVYVYEDANPPIYEVEFFDENEETIDVLTVKESDIELRG